MLSQKDIEMLTVPKETKLHALFDVLRKLNDADELLREAIYDYMPMSENDVWQDEADRYFWNTEGMDEINKVSITLGKACDLARLAIHVLEDTSQAQVAC